MGSVVGAKGFGLVGKVPFGAGRMSREMYSEKGDDVYRCWGGEKMFGVKLLFLERAKIYLIILTVNGAVVPFEAVATLAYEKRVVCTSTCKLSVFTDA